MAAGAGAAEGVRLLRGPWRGRILQETSLVTGPDGRLLLEGPANRETLFTVTLP
jgi:hypothetical protein